MYGPKKNMLVWGSWPPKGPTPEKTEPTGPPADQEEIKSGHLEDGGAEQFQTAAGEIPQSDSTGFDEERISPLTGPPVHHPAPPPGPPYPGMELARAYMPIQRYGPTYRPSEALEKGTLFPELYRPYSY